MSTIAYDRPVKDLIDELNATGHVTHNSYTKTSVTLHHNAGNLTHEQVLNVWKTRPASAHFDVDAAGAVAQYVLPHEYAWAVGNTEGNMRSISIEMANSSLSPDWEVSSVTWMAAARLAGWLFAKIVKARPTNDNFFRHKHWAATACAGPHIDKVWSQVLLEAQKSYDYFTSAPTPPPTVPKLEWTRNDVINFQKTMGLTGTNADGKWGIRTDTRGEAYRDVAYYKDPESDAQQRLVQYILGVTPDGIIGPITLAAMEKRTKLIQGILHVTKDGDWGKNTNDHYNRFRAEWKGRY